MLILIYFDEQALEELTLILGPMLHPSLAQKLQGFFLAQQEDRLLSGEVFAMAEISSAAMISSLRGS